MKKHDEKWKTVVEGSEVENMAIKNLKVDSPVVKWERVENLWEGLYVPTVCCFFISVITIMWNLTVFIKRNKM